MIFRTLSDLSREWKSEVDVLKPLVHQAWINCTIDYIQLRVAALANKDEPYNDYLKQTVRDLASFKMFYSDLEPPGFRNRYVWRFWHYIRPLVLKYIPDWQNDGRIRRLDDGKQKSIIQFWLCGVVAGFQQAEVEERRLQPTVTEDQWNRLPWDPLDTTLIQAVRFCGYEKTSHEPWHYSDIFGPNSDTFIDTVVS
jgi:hypothetical protein